MLRLSCECKAFPIREQNMFRHTRRRTHRNTKTDSDVHGTLFGHRFKWVIGFIKLRGKLRAKAMMSDVCSVALTSACLCLWDCSG